MINKDDVDIHIYITLIDTEEGHLLIEKLVNIFFVTPLSVSLHNLLDFYNLFVCAASSCLDDPLLIKFSGW